MTLKEALWNHNLDVGALEISSPAAQLANLEVWMSRVDSAQKDDAALLVRVAGKQSRRQKLTTEEAQAATAILKANDPNKD